uniref:C3H1-type domain-containing protein n=1 Tax=viral metagenome TaxID=1070528 RepID=A0A6C0D7F5_9ZZZZ
MTWTGTNEKKWDWFKHTKPCYNILASKTCDTPNCNYAHTLDQYVSAILKRKFKLDFNIVNQLKLVDVDSELNSYDDSMDQPSAKKARCC